MKTEECGHLTTIAEAGLGLVITQSQAFVEYRERCFFFDGGVGGGIPVRCLIIFIGKESVEIWNNCEEMRATA